MFEVAPVTFVLLIATGATVLIIVIACSSFWCRSTKRGTVHNHYHQPNQMPSSVLVNLQTLQDHPSTSVQVLCNF